MSISKSQIEDLRFPVQIDLPGKALWHLIVSAFEGGSNYWIRSVEVARVPDVASPEYPVRVSEVPLLDGCLLVVLQEETGEYRPDATDVHRSRKDARLLDRSAIAAGLAILATGEAGARYRHHFRDILADSADADTGDVFLQFCLFGEVVYA